MSALMAIGSGFSVMVLLLIYNILLISPNAEKEGSKTHRFFGSVLPGLFLFLLIFSMFLFTGLWWFGVALNVNLY